jgi:hypothetical protein
MEGAILDCHGTWKCCLPPGMSGLEGRETGVDLSWDLLILTRDAMQKGMCRGSCRLLLMPGDCCLNGIRAEAVATYGLSPRDSLTFSSLQEPVLCVQRGLPRPDGGMVEPQEFPLPPLPEPAEELLPLLGAWLLMAPEADFCQNAKKIMNILTNSAKRV